jgi:2-polyprenyl-6-methoxyphenol hydroxylase-like FAD-dependent oxidoreductase
MTGRTAVVAGGGIGGLSTAIALARRGWRVRVLEQGTPGAAVGTGISLWPNALRALDALGLCDAVRELGQVEGDGGIRDQAGRWLIRTSMAEVERRYGPLVMLHRGDLMNTLAAALPDGSIEDGTRVSAAGASAAGAWVTYGAGSAEADLLIGADGAHSTIRRTLWPDSRAPRYAGYTAWRLIAHASVEPGEGGESWGRGERFGIVPMRDGRVYCFATANTPAGARGPHGELAELRRRFGGWHDPIPRLLTGVREEAVLRHDILETPALASYVTGGRVALVGDAAHAMTPNLGQGGCQAIEDAVVLASVIADAPDLAAALDRYDALRRPRTQAIAAQSRRIGTVGQWSSRPAVAVRGLAMRMMPSRAFLTGLRPVLDWTPGSDDATVRPAARRDDCAGSGGFGVDHRAHGDGGDAADQGG